MGKVINYVPLTIHMMLTQPISNLRSLKLTQPIPLRVSARPILPVSHGLNLIEPRPISRCNSRHNLGSPANQRIPVGHSALHAQRDLPTGWI